jgi:hypothetical protein
MRSDHAAVARLYHGFVTGLILMMVTRRGADRAAELVFRLFRRQHREKFLPGIAKLGLGGLPAAVAAAQYHYLSNQIGGVRVEYIRDSDRKAWIRYPPPRWIWEGTAICAVPSQVSTAMLRGWHAENGVSLGNPRLGFVYTKQTVDGDDALEGYFYEYDDVLRPEERLRHAPGEHAPPFDPALAPELPQASWSAERLAKAARNYSMDYVRSALPELIGLLGAADARSLGAHAARLIGMQYYAELCALLELPCGGSVKDFAAILTRMAEAQEDRILASESNGRILLQQQGWRLADGAKGLDEDAFFIWSGLWQGCAAAHNRTVRVQLYRKTQSQVEWTLAEGEIA